MMGIKFIHLKKITFNVVKKDLPHIAFLHHYHYYALYAEWHFFATSHGKNACDGFGGTIKRMAAYASLH